MVLDTATAAGSSPRLCVDREYPVSTRPFYEWLLYWDTLFLWILRFGKLHAQLGV